MRRLATVALVLAAAAACFAASTTSAATHPKKAFAGPTRQHLTSPNGAVSVQFKVQRFVRSGKGLSAVGQAVATYHPSSGASKVIRKSFSARVLVGRSGLSANRLCPVLFLQIDKLSLVLLGLHVDLDKVVLTITANSRGGVLGSLFCSIARSKVKLLHSTGALNKVAAKSGLASSGLAFNVPVQSKTAEAAQAATCQVLDLVLGPIDLNLLGLLVHLNQVHLAITADPNGGVLGSLFCSLTH